MMIFCFCCTVFSHTVFLSIIIIIIIIIIIANIIVIISSTRSGDVD
jgi:hypothetical protein